MMRILTSFFLLFSLSANASDLNTYLEKVTCGDLLSSFSKRAFTIDDIEVIKAELSLSEALALYSHHSDKLKKDIEGIVKAKYSSGEPYHEAFVKVLYTESNGNRHHSLGDAFLCRFTEETFGNHIQLRSITYNGKDYTNFTRLFTMYPKPDRLGSLERIKEPSLADRAAALID